MAVPTRGIRRFGRHLRSIREARKLSLDAVEELAGSYPEQVTKSHLSRIENGQAEPSFRRLYTLGRIYGVSVSSLAEQYELDLDREGRPEPTTRMSPQEMLDEAAALGRAGDHLSALGLYEMMMESSPSAELHLLKTDCLVSIGQYEVARDEAELVLDLEEVTDRQRRIALHYLAMSSYRKGRLSIAAMLLEEVTRDSVDEAGPGLAHVLMTKGNIENARERWEAATSCYERAMKLYGESARGFDECIARRNLAAVYLKRGKLKRARELLMDVVQKAEKFGYDKQLALALGDLGIASWRSGDERMTETYCRRSNEIARTRDYLTLVFRNCYYLWKVALNKGNDGAARVNLRTLRSYSGRIDPSLPELNEFNACLEGGESC